VASDIHQLLLNIRNNPLEIPKDTKISPQVEDVLRKMLVMDPSQRISWEDLFNHDGKKGDFVTKSGAYDGG
jgi:serine/threonine-protein kinase ULK/ATG1